MNKYPETGEVTPFLEKELFESPIMNVSSSASYPGSMNTRLNVGGYQ